MSTKLRSAELVGAQRPRVASVPRAKSSSGREAVELAASAGLVLDPWQAWTLEQALGERPDGKWAATEVGLLVPRQNGKGSILEARELAGLFLFGARLIMHSAHEFKTAQEAFARVLFLVENNDDMRRKVKSVRTSHGEEGIELKGGQRLRFIARSRTSGRGFTGDDVILDEAFALTSTMMGALMPTLSARPNPQVWYTSSAGDETALTLANVRRRGHAKAPGLAYFEWSAPSDVDLDDRRGWAQANPGAGYRITEESIERERGAMEPAEFARERLGIWQIEQRKRVIAEDAWNEVLDAAASPAAPMRFGMDCTPDRTSGSIVAAGGRVLELVDHHAGVGWMAERAVYLAKKWEGVVVVDANGPAASIADDVESEGVSVERLNGPELARACARFYDGITQGAFVVRPHTTLSASVAGAVKKTSGDRFTWSRMDSSADPTPIIAASLAAAVPKSEPEGEDFVFVA